MKIEDIEKKLKIKFKDRNLLVQSLTHKSYDKNINNEKLEFLGDRVLGFIIAKELLELYPNEKEGILDKKLASLVNKKKCYDVCKFLQLNQVIKTNTSTRGDIVIENKIISDACEAIIGAVFLDQGIKVAEKVILYLWSTDLKNSIKTEIDATCSCAILFKLPLKGAPSTMISGAAEAFIEPTPLILMVGLVPGTPPVFTTLIPGTLPWIA